LRRTARPACPRSIILLLVGLTLLLGHGQIHAVQAEEPVITGLSVLRSDAEGMQLAYQGTQPYITLGDAGGQPCQEVGLEDLPGELIGNYGLLPVVGALLGIPQDGTSQLQVQDLQWADMTGSYTLCPQAVPLLERDGSGAPQFLGNEVPAPAIVLDDTFLPAEPVQLLDGGTIRSQRTVRLRINPVAYNPSSGQMKYIRSLRIAVEFGPGRSAGEWRSEPYFEEILSNLLLNYDQARAWRAETDQADFLSADHSNRSGQGQYKLAVQQDGLYRVSYDNLLSAGIPASELDSLDPRSLRLLNQGSQVAIQVIGEEDGIFTAGEYLLFYGEKVDSKYTDSNIYWLGWGGELGLRMAEVDGTPGGTASQAGSYLTTLHIEQNIDYYNERPSGSDRDHWYWSLVYASSGPAYLDFSFDLQHLETGTLTATVRGLLKGYTATPSHHTQVYLNGNLIDDAAFAKGSDHYFSVDVPQSYLVEGVNTLRVRCPRDGSITRDAVLVNWFEIDYQHTYDAQGDRLFFDGDAMGTWNFQVDGFSSADIALYDITQPGSPSMISGALVEATVNGYQVSFDALQVGQQRYLALTPGKRLAVTSIQADQPSSWRSTANAADYIIISHADFIGSLQPLVDLRVQQGYRVAVVDVQDVYDEFNGGVFSPLALRDFLAYAYASWSAPAPSFVLLVGDGHYDYRNYLGRNNKNFIPPYLDDVDPWIGETATDNRYVSVSGEDILPDMHIGRFPVRTAAETQVMVQKTVNYETVLPLDGWNHQVTFVADDADSGGDYDGESDQLIETVIPGHISAEKIYYKLNYTDPTATRTAIKTAINAGRLLVHYAGHGDVQNWAFEPLFSLSDVASLVNSTRLPVMLPMTCLEGYFIHPSPTGADYSSLGEGIVRRSGGGAVASWSPTGYGLTVGHILLSENLLSGLYAQHIRQLGVLTTQAKYALFASGSGLYNDLIETYALFGDPALILQSVRPPQGISLSDDSILEDQPPASLVGTFSSSDPDAGDTFTYSLAAGEGDHDNPSFQIAGDQLLSNTIFDYQVQSSYTIRVRSTDRDGFWFEQAFTIHIDPIVSRIDLLEGWNLVSFNVVPASTGIADVLADIADQYRLVYAWDGSGAHSSTGHWLKYDPALGFGNTLTTLDERQAFWILMDANDTLDIFGSRPGQTQVHLYTAAGGWNLVGFPAGSAGPLPGVLSGQGVANFTRIYTYLAADLEDPWKLFDPAGAVYANDLLEFSPTQGYWIQVPAEVDWLVSY